MRPRFWESTPLASLTDPEWEALCDGCGRCCLIRFENPDGEGVFYTRAACKLLDIETCRCSDYSNRLQKVTGCLSIRELEDRAFSWLPVTCAYRRLKEGQKLPDWHPLLTGRRESVIEAGVSVAGRVFSEEHIHPDEVESLLLED